jgi:hypothetical protein
LAIGVRVVDDGREEIDRLHERRAARPRVHTRIVRGPEVDQDTVIGRVRDVAQDLGELAGGEFSRSTGASRVIGQPFLHEDSVMASEPASLQAAEPVSGREITGVHQS